VGDWTKAQRQIAERYLERFLEGVGVPSELRIDEGEIALHWRRPMTAAESDALPRKPVQIRPAVATNKKAATP
jgi:hypothetical protein